MTDLIESIAAYLITLEHAVNEVAQWPPEVLATRKVVLINEEDIVLEASVQMGFKSKFTDDRVVMAIDVRVNTVHSLEDLTNHGRKCLWEWNTCTEISCCFYSEFPQLTDTAWKHRLVINVALNPGHQVLDVGRGWHLGWTLEVLRILPKILKPSTVSS